MVIHEQENFSRANVPKVIGLTGGIGAGKSAVGRILKDLGCVLFEADATVRILLETDPEVRKTLVSWWGDEIINDQGEVDRARVAGIVFADPDQLKRLEDVLHPLVERQRARMWEELQIITAGPEQSPPAFVIDAPLLFEAGLDRLCDAVIFVDASEETRLNRVREGRGWSGEELKNREKAQWAVDMKREKSDFVVENEGSLSDLQDEVRSVLEKIVAGDGGESFA